MDRKQRVALTNLLTNHVHYVNCTGDAFTDDEFEEAKAAYNKAKTAFIECESVEVKPKAAKKRLL